MKIKTILILIATVVLTQTSFGYFVINPTNDTIPAEAKKVTEKESNDEFSDIEKELDELSPNSKGGDTTKIRIGKMKISVIDDGNDIIINKEDLDNNWDNDWDWDDDKDFSFGRKKDKDRFEPHWAGIGISMNGFLNNKQEMSLPTGAEYLDLNTNKSLQLDLNLGELGINIVKQRIGLVTGFGFRWNNYRFTNSDVVVYKGEGTVDHYMDTLNSYTKSKLGVTYLTVPLLLEFQIPVKDESLYISGGVEGGLKLTAKMKNKNDDGQKTKDKSDFYINPYTYNLTARLGYGGLGIYGVYNMQALFKKDNGPELYPFALGVTFNF